MTILRTTSDDPQRAAAVSNKLEAMANQSAVVELPPVDATDPLALYAVMIRDLRILATVIKGLAGFEGTRVGMALTVERTCLRLIAAARMLKEMP